MTPVSGLVLVIALAQNPAAAGATAGRIAGRVTVEGTDAPLADARVVLIPAARPMQPMIGPPPQTTTDQDGRFAFSGLKPGEYRLDVQRTGYASLEEPGRGRTIQLAEGQSIDSLVVQLQKGAVIAGRILGPSGEPQPDVRVMAMRRIAAPNGPTRLIPAPVQGLQQTNDLGEFRLSGLAPGEYYVSASPHALSPFGGSGVATAPPQGAARTTLATTYYPGTTEVAAAQPVAVPRGAEVGNIAFMLLSLPAFRVSGVVVDEDGKPIAGAMVMLTGDPRNGLFMGPAGNARSGDDGRFEIDDVVAGVYRANASVPMMMSGAGGGFVGWSLTSSGVTTVSASGAATAGVAVSSSSDSGSGAVNSTDARMQLPTEVVVTNANVTGIRLVAHRSQ
jgi:hypothetical protein